ncbi:MAG: transaldolase family protein [Planctomycetota bacterium]|jgi:transaldolase|nr:transaldolase family protein [Planctomycetota bacterium]MDP7133585.1 transaldolase family protein [Planctomycetota bacterium]
MATTASSVRERVADLAKQGVNVTGEPREAPTSDIWQKLADVGTELWLDTGDIDMANSLWSSEFTALTTNNTLLSNEVTKGIYDDLIKTAIADIREADSDITDDAVVIEIGLLLNAHHGLRLVENFGCKVSVELHTDLSHDFENTIETAHRLYEICPDFFIVKVPYTPTGVVAVRQLVKEGIPINFTLEFAARQNYIAARIANPTYCNVFLGRLNAYVADYSIGDGKYVGEKAIISSQLHLRELKDAGQCSTKQIAASMREAEQVQTLAGLDVFTMPTGVAEGMPSLGLTPDDICGDLDPDLQINLSEGICPEASGLNTLWDVSDGLKAAMDELTAQDDLDDMRGDCLAGFLKEKGLGDIFPEWTDQQIADIAADGKIPNYDRWKDILKEGTVGLDALFNASAWCSFAADQKKLDDRIRSFM